MSTSMLLYIFVGLIGALLGVGLYEVVAPLLCELEARSRSGAVTPNDPKRPT